MKVLVKALRTHTYAGKPRKVGLEYEADKEHVQFLRTVGSAKQIPQTYQTRVMVAEPVVKPKRKYTKRKKAE